MTTLLVIGFPYPTTADAAAQDVLRLEPDLAIEADALAVVSRDEAGVFRVTTNYISGRDQHPSFWSLLFSAVILHHTSLIDAKGERQDSTRQMARLGMDEYFQDRLREMVAPDTSALFLLAEGGVPIEVIASLGRFGGKLLTASLVPDLEVKIAHVLQGTHVLGS